MDKTTTRRRGGEGFATLEEALGRLLEALARGRVEWLDARAEQGRARASQRRPRWYYEPHAHEYFEIAFCLEGDGSLGAERWTDRGWRDRALVLTPGLRHAEGPAPRGGRLQRLWTVLAPGGARFHITRADGREGFTVGSRWLTPLPANHFFFRDGLKERVARGARARFRFQAQLMELVCESLDRIARSPADSASYHDRVVLQIEEYLRDHQAEPIALKELAGMVHYSPNHLNRLFRERTGATIRQRLIELRLERADRLLRGSDLSVKEIAYRVGFADPLYFSRLYRRRCGAPPSQRGRAQASE